MSSPTAISLRKWDSTPQNTKELEIVTKISDLGNPGLVKSFLGVYVSFYVGKPWTLDNQNAYNFSISYRQNTGKPFIPVAHFISGNYSGTSQGERNERIHFESPIPVKNIQLQLKSVYLKGDVLINDFGLMYRTKRTISSTTHDE
tara:strand:- start:2020 stop:2454 length:435 start_codon:yes stop_codon:yes gene_type:complete